MYCFVRSPFQCSWEVIQEGIAVLPQESHPVWNQGAVIKSQLWWFSHFRPGHQPPHQLLSATSQRCANMKALQLTCWRWTRDAWTENSFKATVSTTLVPGIYPVESCNTLTTPLIQWPLTQVPITWSMLKAFTEALHMGKPDNKCMTVFHEYSHPRLHGIGTPSRCFTKHHTHPCD